MLLTLLFSCTPSPEREARVDLLPSHVAVTVTFADGEPGTVLADLQGPDKPPKIRIAEDALVFRDGRPVEDSSRISQAHAEGPGQGFTVEQRGDTVVLVLPKSDDPVVLVQGVARIQEVALLPEIDTLATDQAFHRVHALHAAPVSARIDGVLDEWDGRAAAIDEPSQILEGAETWSGPRDGSVAIAARAHHDRISFGLRVRDDDLRLGEDAIELDIGVRSVVVPLAEAGACAVPEGWECAFVEAVEFGTGVELSLPDTRQPTGEPMLAAVVRYVDVDEEGTTVLASAPSLQAVERYGVQRPGPKGSPANNRIPTSTMP